MEVTNALHHIRLAARIHGRIDAVYPELERELIKQITGRTTLFKRPKHEQLEAIKTELPVLLLILTLQEVERAEMIKSETESELLKSCLVHFFAIYYNELYLDHQDPIRETFNRVDWYLDGEFPEANDLFVHFVSNIFPDIEKDALTDQLNEFVNQRIMGEIQRAVELGPKYRF